MAAKDYTFAVGSADIWLTKNTKPRKNGVQVMSTDRRPIEESEILYIFEHYLRNWCDAHEGEDSLVVVDDNNRPIFMAKLLDLKTESET